MDSLSIRITGSNPALSREKLGEKAQADDAFHPRRSTGSSVLSGLVKSEKEDTGGEFASPETTPKKHRRTFVLSPVPQSPYSRRSAAHLGSPASLTSRSESREFQYDSGYFSEAGPLGYGSSPNYCQFSHALLTPVSETGSNLDLESRSFSFSEPELSIGSDTTDEQSSLLSTDSSDLPDIVRIQSGETLFDSPALRVFRGSEITLPDKTSLLSPAPVNSQALIIDTSSLNKHLAHLTSPYLHPPLGTFRSSYTRKLRSETLAEAREYARRRERRRFERMVDDATRQSGSITRADEEDEELECADYKDIVLGISELDIFGVGAHMQDMENLQYTSSPWRRSVRAPLRLGVTAPSHVQDSSKSRRSPGRRR